MADPQEIRQDEADAQAASSDPAPEQAAQPDPAREQASPPDAEQASPPDAEQASPPDAEQASPPGSAAEEPAAEAEDAPAEGPPPDDGRPREELLAALAQAERERDEYVDFLRRERAEFENYRKRSARERLEALDRGAERVAEGLLGVLDNFDHALGAAESSEDEALAKGVQMVHTELLASLTNAGLEEIAGEGVEFDPEHHEAMMQVEAADELGREVDEPVVAEVLRRGYRFKGRVLRPASVKVAR